MSLTIVNVSPFAGLGVAPLLWASLGALVGSAVMATLLWWLWRPAPPPRQQRSESLAVCEPSVTSPQVHDWWQSPTPPSATVYPTSPNYEPVASFAPATPVPPSTTPVPPPATTLPSLVAHSPEPEPVYEPEHWLPPAQHYPPWLAPVSAVGHDAPQVTEPWAVTDPDESEVSAAPDNDYAHIHFLPPGAPGAPGRPNSDAHPPHTSW